MIYQEIPCRCKNCMYSKPVAESAWEQELKDEYRNLKDDDLVCTYNHDPEGLPLPVEKHGYCQFASIRNVTDTFVNVYQQNKVLMTLHVKNYDDNFDATLKEAMRIWIHSKRPLQETILPLLQNHGYQAEEHRCHNVFINTYT